MAATMIVRLDDGAVINVPTEEELLDKTPFGKKGVLEIIRSDEATALCYRDKSGSERWRHVVTEGCEFMVTPSGAELISSQETASKNEETFNPLRAPRIEMGRGIYRGREIALQRIPAGHPYAFSFPSKKADLWVTDGTLEVGEIDDTTSSVLITNATWAAFGLERAVVWQGASEDALDELFYQLGLAGEVFYEIKRAYASG